MADDDWWDQEIMVHLLQRSMSFLIAFGTKFLDLFKVVYFSTKECQV